MTEADKAVAMFSELVLFFHDRSISEEMKDTAARTIVQYLEIVGFPKPNPQANT